MSEPHDPYAALRIPGFQKYLSGNFVAMLGYQMQLAAVNWEVYDRTRDLKALGFVGLIQFLPVLIMSLPAGTLADRFNRKRIVQIAYSVLSLGSLGLMLISWRHLPIPWMYGLLLLNGLCRAIQQPAKAALLPLIVPRSVFANAQIWHGSGFQLAMVGGPMLASAIIAITGRPAWVYLFEAVTIGSFAVLLQAIPVPPQERSSSPNPFAEVAGGLAYVWKNRFVLSAISLDMFAVLLGGVTALIAVYARDVLDLQAELGWMHAWRAWLPAGMRQGASGVNLEAIGYGLMRAAPAVGALTISMIIAQRKPMERPGRALLWSVAGFGVASVVFGLSRSFWLSVLMLAFTGAFDMVSVVIRHAIVQLLTPDHMRGRVSAVNGLFIGASNELGAAESAYVANLFDRREQPAFGPTVSVVSGGIGTLVVVGTIALLHPQLRRLRKQDLNPVDATV